MNSTDPLNELFSKERANAPTGFDQRVMRAIHTRPAVAEAEFRVPIKWLVPIALLLIANLTTLGLVLMPGQDSATELTEEAWTLSSYEWMDAELNALFKED